MDIDEQKDILTLTGEDFELIGVDPASVNKQLLETVVEIMKEDLYDRFSDYLKQAYDYALDIRSHITYSMWFGKPEPRIHANYTVLDDDTAYRVVSAFEADAWDDETEVFWDVDVRYLSLERKVDDSQPDSVEVTLIMTNLEWLAVSRLIN